jgi:hypothetical protein
MNTWALMAPSDKPNTYGVVMELGVLNIQEVGSTPYANAQLIATAPELLLALEQSLTVMIPGVNEEWISNVKALIAKAKGE